MVSQIKNKKLQRITNTNIKQNWKVSILTYFVGIMNNRHKIISAHRAPS